MQKFFICVSVLFCVCYCNAFAQAMPELPENGDFSDTLGVLLAVPEDEIDLAWTKLVIDTLVDPETSIIDNYQKLEDYVERAASMVEPNHSDQDQVAALRALIYDAGVWNSGEPFSYDFDNPNGRLAKNKTLSHYLITKRGNCVNMPILFAILGQKLGLDINITTAPRHVFVQYYDRQRDQIIHLEPTSGAQPQRISWQRKVLPMTDRAVESGMYMKRLNQKQQIAVMAETLLQRLQETGDVWERLEVALIMINVYPEFDIALLHLQSVHHEISHRYYINRFGGAEKIPYDLIPHFDRHLDAYKLAWQRLDKLGWQRPVDTPEVVIPD